MIKRDYRQLICLCMLLSNLLWLINIDTASAQTGPPFTTSDYGLALDYSNMFYEAQRAGDTDDSAYMSRRVGWRVPSLLNDGSDIGYDLTGGWFDAGDHVKFHLPMAYSAGVMGMGMAQFGDGYATCGTTDRGLDNLRWVNDYFLKANPAPGVFVGQVGDGADDHSWWGPPELIETGTTAYPMPRETKTLPAGCGGDILGATAGSLAQASIVFRNAGDITYANTLLTAAETYYAEAITRPSTYNSCISGGSGAFYSSSGYEDDWMMGAVSVHLAKEAQTAGSGGTYLTDAISHYNNVYVGGWMMDWDNNHYPATLLLAQATGNATYMNNVESYIDDAISGATGGYTPDGMWFLTQWGSARYPANASYLALHYADYLESTGSTSAKIAQYRAWAQGQIDYLLGDNSNSYSYMVGFGTNGATLPHHRGAHLSSATGSYLSGGPDGWNDTDSGPNENVLYGALVGGPALNDTHNDSRSDYVENEVATDYNAGLQGALAGICALSAPEMTPTPTPTVDPAATPTPDPGTTFTADPQWGAGGDLSNGCFIRDEAGANPWDVLFGSGGHTFVNGETYTVSFEADGDGDVIVVIGDDEDPYTTYGTDTFTLNSTTQTYSFQFTMGEATDTTTNVTFQVGGASGSAETCISNVIISTGSSTATPTNTPIPPTNTPTATSTNTPIPPTNTPTATSTNTPVPPTNTPTATSTNTAVPPTNTPTNTPQPTATFTPLPTATNTPLPTVTNTPLPTSTNTPIPTASNTPLPTATNTPLPTSTNTPIPTATNTPLPTATFTPLPTVVPGEPTFTPSPIPTNTPIPTVTNTPLPTSTFTPLPTATNTPLPTATFTPLPTVVPGEPTFTPSPTATNTPIPTVTNTPLPTATSTPLPTVTNTPLPTATFTPLPTVVPGEPTFTPSPIPTDTPIPTVTNTPLPTSTSTPLPTATYTPIPPTETNTPLPTATFTPLPTVVPGEPTYTPTPIPTNTPIPTATNTPLPTSTSTPLPTATYTPIPPTATNTPLPTATFTPLPTVLPGEPTYTPTNTPLPTATNTPSPTPTNTPIPAATNAPDPMAVELIVNGGTDATGAVALPPTSAGATLSIDIQVDNSTDVAVYVIAMADLNGDGVMSAGETVQLMIPPGGLSEVMPLSFDNAISAPTGSDIPVQVMLSADSIIENTNTATPINGEVEAFMVEVRAPTAVSLTTVGGTANHVLLLLAVLTTCGVVAVIIGRQTN